jgi:ubiquinone biosynthesis protein UbiJ
MLKNLQALLAPALAERLTLVINHVLSSEVAATSRLQPHTGRTVALAITNWPSLLPAPPSLAWRVTPAGMLDWCGPGALDAPDLAVTLDAPNPALLIGRLVGGEVPAVQIDGDAQLAGDVNWLLQNIRWDVAADLERLFGPTVARPLHRIGSALAKALRAAFDLGSRGAAGLGERLRSRGN